MYVSEPNIPISSFHIYMQNIPFYIIEDLISKKRW